MQGHDLCFRSPELQDCYTFIEGLAGTLVSDGLQFSYFGVLLYSVP